MYKPIKMHVEHPDLPEEMLLFRDSAMMEDFLERYSGINLNRLGRLCIAMFRGTEDMPNAGDNDYLGIGRKEEDEWHWYLFFDKQAECTYLGGIALGAERQRLYHSMLRANDFKTSMDKFGWNPSLVIEDVPSQAEEDAYADYLISKYDDIHEDLAHALEEEFED